ncbi:hypothetical protein Lesp02_63640 [Lentzea sp. NBRC 105346]|uniref:hypothetical protein n=1 Tax=Lentzea sp. NBRC 105346 TaxID=3032205 RepID=UPI0024A533B2|nr:hypothetical protein [Lentzea sp. NBRC 105346]GLZ34177.1 hypothetical protein Lesp02_63640 [Lentzea sp. NBRC 105346]
MCRRWPGWPRGTPSAWLLAITAEHRDLGAKIEPLRQDKANQISAMSIGDRFYGDLVMVTPELKAKFDQIGGKVELRPWLRPLS